MMAWALEHDNRTLVELGLKDCGLGALFFCVWVPVLQSCFVLLGMCLSILVHFVCVTKRSVHERACCGRILVFL